MKVGVTVTIQMMLERVEWVGGDRKGECVRFVDRLKT